MVSCLSNLTRALRLFDFFQSSKLLRYNGEAEYKSTTGGITSVTVVIIFVILFSSMALRTVKKEIITSSSFTKSESIPSELDMQMGPGGDMMFGIYIRESNLSSVPRLFDVKLEQIYYNYGYVLNRTEVPLQQCTEAHFSFDADIAAQLRGLPISAILCPQIGHTFNLQGKISSPLFSAININITRCNPAADPTCVNDSTFAGIEAMVGRFAVVPVFINTNINPGSQRYKKYYIEDQNILYFNTQLGTFAWTSIAEDVIQTDASLMPYEQIEEERVVRVPESSTASNFMTNAQSILVKLLFTKSSRKTTYERSFNKVDEYFSYVGGGLIGTIIGFIFIMEFYTETAYEVSIAKKLMVDNNNEQISSKSFNLFYYFSVKLRYLLGKCNYQPDWPTTNLYADCCEEISMQLDVSYIVRKIMFIDAALSKLLKKEELQEIYLRKKPTIQESKEQRKKHYSLQIFKLLDKNKEGEEGKEGAEGSPKEMHNQMYSLPVKFAEKERDSVISDSEDMSAMALSRRSLGYEHMKNILQKNSEGNRGNPSRFRERNQLDVDGVHELKKREYNEPRITINSVLKKDDKPREKKHVVFQTIQTIKD